MKSARARLRLRRDALAGGPGDPGRAGRRRRPRCSPTRSSSGSTGSGSILALSLALWLIGHRGRVLRPKVLPPEAPGAKPRDRAGPTVTHVPAVAWRCPRRGRGPRSHRLGARRAGRPPRRRTRAAGRVVPRRVPARRLRRPSPREAEALVAELHRAARAGPGAGAGRRPRVVGVGERRVDAAPARAAHGPRRRADGRAARSRPIGRRVAGTETGVLLGYLSQRVLGQYDLLVLDDDAAADAVYYVGGNVLGAGEALRVPPARLPLWIAIHEVHAPGAVHRRAVDEALLPVAGRRARSSSIDPDPRRLVQALARAADELRNGRNPLDDGGLVALLASDGAARRARQRAGTHVAARGPRQQRS